jgi:hypothetical protein
VSSVTRYPLTKQSSLWNLWEKKFCNLPGILENDMKFFADVAEFLSRVPDGAKIMSIGSLQIME